MHKILLVDDMRRFLDLERTFLKRAECRMLTAVTGLEAIKVAKTEMPDIIVLDVEMPEMNGLEAARILKNDPQTQHIPIIICTALEGVEERARAAGCDEFRRKPLEEDEFLDVIRRFVPLQIRKVPRAALDVPVVLRENDRLFEARVGRNGSLPAIRLPSHRGHPPRTSVPDSHQGGGEAHHLPGLRGPAGS